MTDSPHPSIDLIDPIEAAVREGAARAFEKAASRARQMANTSGATIKDHDIVVVVSTPESVMAARNAALWDACAREVKP